ncbi:MAG TPA: DUF881 domain-containing protein [Segeticoccus sp.]|uniref:DUF881 domain-containing protein n=1 Tax=Segeticoccus sp. TaxID=2706531 RepID=UPI002D7F2C80|nr:DUF881 domain-containing protein [Segeticoccus sp.]HET8599191.1 DUF881 domain-containing protein [Segeticoccus sp.]
MAASRQRSSASAARRRMTRFLTRRPRGPWSVLVPVVCVLAGVLFATSATLSGGTDLRNNPSDLADVIRQQNSRVEAKAHQVQQLRNEVDRISRSRAPGSARLERLTTRATHLAPDAGTQPVAGPAITVTLDDAHLQASQIPAPYTVDDVVVHQQDVQAVVNALWRGGAEAMMLQDQRVISTSAVRCVGNTLILQGRVYSPPYTIRAIGDVQGMKVALQQDPQVQIYRQYVDLLGLGYQVTAQRKATFPAYEGTLDLPHTSVVGRAR